MRLCFFWLKSLLPITATLAISCAGPKETDFQAGEFITLDARPQIEAQTVWGVGRFLYSESAPTLNHKPVLGLDLNFQEAAQMTIFAFFHGFEARDGMQLQFVRDAHALHINARSAGRTPQTIAVLEDFFHTVNNLEVFVRFHADPAQIDIWIVQDDSSFNRVVRRLDIRNENRDFYIDDSLLRRPSLGHRFGYEIENILVSKSEFFFLPTPVQKH